MKTPDHDGTLLEASDAESSDASDAAPAPAVDSALTRDQLRTLLSERGLSSHDQKAEPEETPKTSDPEDMKMADFRVSRYLIIYLTVRLDFYGYLRSFNGHACRGQLADPGKPPR